jgi:hypothetical protein
MLDALIVASAVDQSAMGKFQGYLIIQMPTKSALQVHVGRRSGTRH